MTSPFGCFACSGADHWETTCPELAMPAAKDRKEHEARIAKYVEWCFEMDPPRITPLQKRKLIEAENARWKKATAKAKEKAK
jgi:hypothetical protein